MATMIFAIGILLSSFSVKADTDWKNYLDECKTKLGVNRFPAVKCDDFPVIPRYYKKSGRWNHLDSNSPDMESIKECLNPDSANNPDHCGKGLMGGTYHISSTTGEPVDLSINCSNMTESGGHMTVIAYNRSNKNACFFSRTVDIDKKYLLSNSKN